MAEAGEGKCVLVVAQRPSDYVEMKRCAEALRSRGYRVRMLYFLKGRMSPEEASLLDEAARLEAAGVIDRVVVFVRNLELSIKGAIEAMGPLEGRELKKEKQRFPDFIIRQKLYQYIKSKISDFESILRAAWVFPEFFMIKRSIKSCLMRMKPDIVVLPEEIVGAVTPLTVKAGHELGIPSLIVPYTIANKQEPFQSLSNYPSYKYSLLPNRLVGSIFRRWVMRQDGVALVRMPATYILGQEFTRTAPPDPWMMNSGYADAIAVENEAMRDYYRAAGIPDGRMRVVGAIYDDTLAGYLNAKAIELPRLRSELGLAGDRPLLVVGGCPDQSGNCPDFEFDSMKVLAGRLVEALAVLRDDYDIVVRPHPNYPELGRLLGAQGLCITMTDTARLVALSDAYVAFGSATIRWAVACGVPTINYDVFRYDYDDFKEVGGVVTVSDYASFARAVAGLALGHPDGRALALRAAEDAPRWGMLDGGSADRIAALIEELCRRPVRRTGRGALHGQVQQEKP